MASDYTSAKLVRKTQFATNLRTGRRECWEAESTDGRYVFTRTEDTGTPWVMYDRNGQMLELFGSLKKAERFLQRPDVEDYLREKALERL